MISGIICVLIDDIGLSVVVGYVCVIGVLVFLYYWYFLIWILGVVVVLVVGLVLGIFIIQFCDSIGVV